MPRLLRATLGALAMVSLLPRPAHATWSIVILDGAHRWIGVAGASCTPDVYGIMNLQPGRGVLIAQAIGRDAAIRRGTELLASGASADSILRALSDASIDSMPAWRQYAIATFDGGVAQSTGDSTASWHGSRRSADGAVLVQGNSLADAKVLDAVMRAIERARASRKPIYEALMAGLAAGARAGGDVRCGVQRATSAFLVVARPGERAFLPWVTLSVFGVEKGGVNAVAVLGRRFRRWVAEGGPRNAITNEGVRPGR